jgi:hypothetical protein
MGRAEIVASSAIAPLALRRRKETERHVFLISGFSLLLICLIPGSLLAQDCLTCHADKGLQNAAGNNISVDGDTFGQSIHGSLKCNDCHADIKEYPHPDKIARVKCDACHASEAKELSGSVHSDGADHPCTSCHGDAHSIFTKDDNR